MNIKKSSIKEYEPLPPLHEQYALKFMEKHRVVKLGISSDGLSIVGICPPFEQNLIDEIQDFHRNKVEFVEIEAEDFTIYLGRLFSSSSEYDAIKGINQHIEIDKFADDAPIINLVNSIFIEAIQKKASDIHIEGRAEQVSIRYRIDGVLVKGMEYDASYFLPISSRIKIMADLNIMEKRLPQDGRISVSIAGIELDMRLSIVPITGGESIVLRLFNRKDSILSINDLGFSDNIKKHITHLYNQSHGLVLFTGPTGSGKTTSLNAIIRNLDSESNMIVTIEDPVEYRIDGINQIQTNDEIGLSFHSILRRVLRQDPNIIMVGEIRDSETAQLAVRAALTGHLVLASLHTNDAISSVYRLINMGVESYLLAAVLRGAVAQRLVRVLCPDCKYEKELTPAEKKIYEKYDLTPKTTFHHKGCPSCNFTGYSGRTTAAECFVTSARLEELMVANSPNSVLAEQVRSEKFSSLMKDGLEKTISGVIDLAEIERVI
ncbi:MAG TPA: type II/IV secretion system protein [Spirochaeta sp.]|nr:type II/IV secretion system protein [Spirochaeta sp.]